MGRCRPQWVLLMIAMAVLMGACARPKPPREVQVPTMDQSPTPALTVPVETPTEAPASKELAAPKSTPEADAEEPTKPAPTATEAPPTPTSVPTPEPTAAPTATEALPTFTYRVQSGDTLGSIATRFGTTSQAIAALNNLPNTHTIRLGQLLLIPGKEPKPVNAAGTIEYRVRAGETLSQIALRHRTSTAAILQMNPSIGSPERLRAGALIVVPVGTEAPVVTHTVAAGETLSSIARLYDVSTQSIISLNGLVDPSRIQAGQVLFIPQ